jgi:WD40 repeat-containing protein SMU1
MATNELKVESSDIIRLIQAHLAETGLAESCRVLREESGVRGAGVAHQHWKAWAATGNWGAILASLDTMDLAGISAKLLAEVYEMAILELGEVGELQLAHATLRLAAEHLDCTEPSKSGLDIPRSRLLEQKLASLNSNGTKTAVDYYGARGKQAKREKIGAALYESIPLLPPSRLTALLQQAIKWQAHTGQLPMVKDKFDEDHDAQIKKKRKRKFDLVLGESNALTTSAQDDVRESIPTSVYSTISFGKSATCEAAVFLPDGSGLVTGSSDGLIEVWDPHQKYAKLRMDLIYQQNDELMGHDDSSIASMAVSNDGMLLATGDSKGDVRVWKIETGSCLRSISAHPGQAISDLCFSPDGSQILTASQDGTCREFSLRTSRMLKEFRGHNSYVNSCQYDLLGDEGLRVVTSSADGTARKWDGKSAECISVLRPMSLGDHLTASGSSIVINPGDATSAESGSPNVHSVIPLHTPAQSMIMVPRGSRAFLVAENGRVLRAFDVADGKSVFVAACVSPSNQWLYAVTDTGFCHVFDVASGDVQTTIRSFAEESCGRTKSNDPEITSIRHHPTKAIVIAFSNGKGQKKGTLTLWK